MALLDSIRERRLASLNASLPCRVTATWAMNGRSRIDPFQESNRPADPYAYAIVSTTQGLGVCYADAHLSAPEDWIGLDARGVSHQSVEWQVALLDAIGPVKPLLPTRTLEGEGLPLEKARWRAKAVADAVIDVSQRIGASPVVVNLGAVGAILDCLSERGCEVHACDMNPAILGQQAGSTKVVCFEELEPYIRPTSVVLVTGMAIANGTMDDVFTLSKKRQASLVIYAETGSSFAGEYLEAGAASVVAETFPFYTMAGRSRICVYAQS